MWRSIGVVFSMSGVSSAPHRRPMESVFLRDLSFWKQIKEGKTAREVLDDWVKRYPDDCYLGEDSVRKAVERVDIIMQGDL